MNAPAPFGFVPIDSRRSTTKPRTRGLSMVIDDGLPNGYLADVLRTSGAHIDIMKIKTGLSRLYPREVLVEKLKMLNAAQVRPFIGG